MLHRFAHNRYKIAKNNRKCLRNYDDSVKQKSVKYTRRNDIIWIEFFFAAQLYVLMNCKNVADTGIAIICQIRGFTKNIIHRTRHFFCR